MSPHLPARIFSGLLIVFATVGTAAAQERGLIGGQVGVTFQANTAPFIAAEVAGHVTPALQIYGTVGRLQDILPGEIQDLLAFIDDRLDASAPAVFAVGGVRGVAPRGAVRPYGLGGAGITHLSGKIEFDGRDVTALGLAVAGFDEDELETTELAFELGGGVLIPFGSAFLDAGYRFLRLIDSEVNVSRAYVGFGYAF